MQDARTVRKILRLDEHVLLAFVGLTADACVLVNRAQIECQSHCLTVEDIVTIEYITRFIARLHQKYTQSSGVRSFGISTLIATLIVEFDPYMGVLALYQTRSWWYYRTSKISN